MATVDRLSLAPNGELGALIRASAAQAGESVSGWLIEAAQMRLRNEILGHTLAAWFAEDGWPTAEEIAEAEALYDAAGIPRPAGDLAASLPGIPMTASA